MKIRELFLNKIYNKGINCLKLWKRLKSKKMLKNWAESMKWLIKILGIKIIGDHLDIMVYSKIKYDHLGIMGLLREELRILLLVIKIDQLFCMQTPLQMLSSYQLSMEPSGIKRTLLIMIALIWDPNIKPREGHQLKRFNL